MLTNQQLNNLACEIIETINKYKVEDSFLIVLPDKSYDNLYGWKTWIPNLYDYAESKDEILGDELNMFIDGDIHTMFNESPEIISEWKGIENVDRISNCYKALCNLFNGYDLEWKHFYHGYGLSFNIGGFINGV